MLPEQIQYYLQLAQQSQQQQQQTQQQTTAQATPQVQTTTVSHTVTHPTGAVQQVQLAGEAFVCVCVFFGLLLNHLCYTSRKEI